MIKSRLDSLAPGVGVVAITGLAAMFLSEHYNTPVMLLALLLGVAVSFLYEETRCREGIDFVSSHLLRIGVALIGLRIALSDLVELGWQAGLLIVFAVASTIIFGIILCRIVGMPKHFGALTGGAVGICGASAALALASVLPDDENKQRDTLITVIGVTLLSTIAMIAYPIIAAKLNLSTNETSLFLGGTIHDVAQVVGAGYSVSSETGDLATLTKLVRVSLLVPVVLIFVLLLRRKRSYPLSEQSNILPRFLLAFVAFMLLNSFFNIPDQIVDSASSVSRFSLVMAIAGIGMKSNLRQLVEVGFKPFLILLSETVWILLVFLLYVKIV